MVMKWEEDLNGKLAHLKGFKYDELYQICLSAYNEGRFKEKRLAVEAYRLRCGSLFGNRCMLSSCVSHNHKKICDGDCYYLKIYQSELWKLEG